MITFNVAPVLCLAFDDWHANEANPLIYSKSLLHNVAPLLQKHLIITRN